MNSEDDLPVDASREDLASISERMETQRQRLRRLVKFRMDPRIQGRVDASDVVQEVFVEACQRVREYLQRPDVPLFVWLRFLATQKLAQVHRRHLGTQARDAGREVSRGPAAPDELSAKGVEWLPGSITTPSERVMRNELQARLWQVVQELPTIDREILVLRHLEQLSNREAASVLGIGETAASNRYVRALARLRQTLEPPAP